MFFAGSAVFLSTIRAGANPVILSDVSLGSAVRQYRDGALGHLRVLLLVLAATLALAPKAVAGVTVAVLPLEPGAGSEQYAGLGRALAGMLVSDLSEVPALELVERDRLDAVLAEIELGESGFVDPTTAVTLGRGVGAEAMVLGSWSVVEQTFLMDARVVRTKDGSVVKAAFAQGPLADFVGVEKEVVEALLHELAIELTAGDRRRLMMQAPTESFTALTAWGEGLEAEVQGDLDGAVAAYERAVRSDPRFAAAQALLEQARAAVEARRSKARTEQGAALDQAMASLLAAVPDERQRRRGFTHDTWTGAEFLVRMAVLELQGKHCQRFEEMWAYGERVGWKLAPLPRSPSHEGVRGYLVGKVAEAHGLDTPEARLAAREIDRDGLKVQGRMVDDVTNFVLDNRVNNQRELGHGLVGALHRCFAPAGRLEQLDRLHEHLGKAGLLDEVRNPNHARFPLGLLLQLEWVRASALYFGVDEALSRRVEAVLAHPFPDDPVSADRLVDRVDDLLREAERTETARRQALGMTTAAFAEELHRVIAGEGIAAARAEVCARLVQTSRSQLESWLERADTELASHVHPEDAEVALRGRALGPGAMLASLRQLGCAPGTDVEIGTKAEALAVVDAALAGVVDSDTCRTAANTLRSVSQSWRDSDYPLPEEQLPMVIFSLLHPVNIGLGQGCFELH